MFAKRFFYHSFVSTCLLLVAVVVLTACSKGGGSDRKISHVEISPLTVTFAKNVVLDLELTIHYKDGGQSTPQEPVTWVSSAPSVATVSAQGLLTTITAGNSTIVAKYRGFEAQKNITVNDATLTALLLEADNKVINGNTIPVIVFAAYSDGSKHDVSHQVQWSVSDASILENTGNNQFQALKIGVVELQANYQSLSGQVQLQVVDATLSTIEIVTQNNQYLKDTEITLNARGIYANGIKQDISSQVTWQFSNNKLVAHDPEQSKLALLETGEIQIIATLNDVSAQLIFSIVDLELVELIVNSEINTALVGQQFTVEAVGKFSDGSQEDLTDEVQWSSSNQDILITSNVSGSKGKVLGVEVGTAEIRASLDGITGSLSIKAVNGALLKIHFNESTLSLANGTNSLLKATGEFESGFLLPLIDVVWSSSDPSIVSVSNQNATAGKVTGINVGKALVTAEYLGVKSEIEVTITEAQLLELKIELAYSEIPKNSQIITTVVGVFDDGSHQDLTNQVSWKETSEKKVVSFKNESEAPGVILTHDPGVAQIEVKFNNVSASENLIILDATLESIIFQVEKTEINIGTKAAVTVIGNYSDGISRDITAVASLVSSNQDIVTIVKNPDNTQSILGVAPGVVTLKAEWKTLKAFVNVSVYDSSLTEIEISPQIIYVPLNESRWLYATGKFSNGTLADVTDSTIWQSSDPSILVVSNGANSRGKIYALTLGEVTVSAGLGSTVKVIVSDTKLEAINISFTGNSVVANNTQTQLKAIGIYSDGHTEDITQVVTWLTDSSQRCKISNVKNQFGLLTAINPGKCKVSARMGNISSPALFTITDAQLQSITIESGDTSIAIGTHKQMVVLGNYNDGTTQPITNLVTWDEAGGNVEIASSIRGKGLIRGISVGENQVTASFAEISSSITINVTDATVQSISISPQVSELAKGSTKLFTAIGNFSDGSTQNLSDQVIWQSNNNSVAMVSNHLLSVGLVSAISEGDVAISASYNNGVTSLISDISVVNNPTQPASISMVPTPNIILNDGVDTTEIEVRVNAIDSGFKVPDGTVVNLEILNTQDSSVSTDFGELSTQSVTTTDGLASFTFKTNYLGNVSIRASIEDTEIESMLNISSVDTLFYAIKGTAIFIGSVEDNKILEGSIFLFSIKNDSNRKFSLDKLVIGNDGVEVEEITNAETLNDNLLPAGYNHTITYKTKEDGPNEYTAIVDLTDSLTGNKLSIQADLTIKQ